MSYTLVIIIITLQVDITTTTIDITASTTTDILIYKRPSESDIINCEAQVYLIINSI